MRRVWHASSATLPCACCAHTTAWSREHVHETWLHVTSQDKYTALMAAAANSATGVAKLLIDAGADVAAVDKVCWFAVAVLLE